MYYLITEFYLYKFIIFTVHSRDCSIHRGSRLSIIFSLSRLLTFFRLPRQASFSIPRFFLLTRPFLRLVKIPSSFSIETLALAPFSDNFELRLLEMRSNLTSWDIARPSPHGRTRLTVKFRTRCGSELPPRGKTVRLGSSTHVHTWRTRRRAAGGGQGGGSERRASAPPLCIDYESDRLAKENSVRAGGGGGHRERVEDEDEGC